MNENQAPLRLTAREINAKRTPKGSWTRAQLAEWGVAWPPPRGWRKLLIYGAPDADGGTEICQAITRYKEAIASADQTAIDESAAMLADVIAENEILILAGLSKMTDRRKWK